MIWGSFDFNDISFQPHLTPQSEKSLSCQFVWQNSAKLLVNFNKNYQKIIFIILKRKKVE